MFIKKKILIYLKILFESFFFFNIYLYTFLLLCAIISTIIWELEGTWELEREKVSIDTRETNEQNINNEKKIIIKVCLTESLCVCVFKDENERKLHKQLSL